MHALDETGWAVPLDDQHIVSEVPDHKDLIVSPDGLKPA